MIDLKLVIKEKKKKWHRVYLCHKKLRIIIIFYIPVNKAIAAIIPRNNKIIPMATKVSCSSTELIFFIIFNFIVNKNCVLKGKLEKNLTIRSVFRGKDCYKVIKKSGLYKFY